MPKRRRPKLTSTVIFVDAMPYLIVGRTKKGFEARRLEPSEEERAVRQLDDLHAELVAVFTGGR